MTKNEALTVASNCIYCIESGKIDSVWNELLPVLNKKTSFQMLDIIGGKIGERAVACKDIY